MRSSDGPSQPCAGPGLETHRGSRPLKFHCGHWQHSQVDATVAMCRASRSRWQGAESESESPQAPESRSQAPQPEWQ